MINQNKIINDKAPFILFLGLESSEEDLLLCYVQTITILSFLFILEIISIHYLYTIP